MSLNSPSVSGEDTEQSVEELLNEFFKLYFVGAAAPSDVCTNQVETPDGTMDFLVASLAFQAGPLDFSGLTSSQSLSLAIALQRSTA